MVVGHTVQKNGISSACDERIWRVDIGASNAFHSFRETQNIEVLEIVYDKNNKAKYSILK